MSRHGHESGRLDLPFVGIATFGKRPCQPDWARLPADVAVLGAPSHGGFLHYDVLELLQQIARRHEVVGIAPVEVAPDYDATGSTAILAAQILLNFLGFIFHARGH